MPDTPLTDVQKRCPGGWILTTGNPARSCEHAAGHPTAACGPASSRWIRARPTVGGTTGHDQSRRARPAVPAPPGSRTSGSVGGVGRRGGRGTAGTLDRRGRSGRPHHAEEPARRVVALRQGGGDSAKDTAERALTGSDQQIDEFLKTGLNLALEGDNRLRAIGMLNAPGASRGRSQPRKSFQTARMPAEPRARPRRPRRTRGRCSPPDRGRSR
ncbi:ALF repeat-containing protein [Streptomyces sp. NC-S4]